MQNFQETFETPKSSSINAFLICMTVPLRLGFPDHSNGLALLYFARFLKISMFPRQKYQSHTGDQKKAKFLKMISKYIIFKFFIEFTNHERNTNRAVVFSYRCLPNILKYCDHRWNFPKFRRFWRIKIHSDTNWKIQLIYIWKFRFTVLQNYHWNTKKMGNLWVIKVGYDPN